MLICVEAALLYLDVQVNHKENNFENNRLLKFTKFIEWGYAVTIDIFNYRTGYQSCCRELKKKTQAKHPGHCGELHVHDH